MKENSNALEKFIIVTFDPYLWVVFFAAFQYNFIIIRWGHLETYGLKSLPKYPLSQVRFGFPRILHLKYRDIHEKGSEDVASAVSYTIYLSLCTHTAETTSPEHFS